MEYKPSKPPATFIRLLFLFNSSCLAKCSWFLRWLLLPLELVSWTCNLNVHQLSLSFTSAIVEDWQREGRAVGGVGVTLGQVPFMASLRSLANQHFCGGSILSNRWILTSATCTNGRALNSINVVVGTVTLNAGGVTYRSANITEHPSFDRISLENE